MAATLSSGNDEIEFDFSQLDDTLINDQQKQSLLDYINQIKTQKRVIHDELTSFKASTGTERVSIQVSSLNEDFFCRIISSFLLNQTNERVWFFFLFARCNFSFDLTLNYSSTSSPRKATQWKCKSTLHVDLAVLRCQWMVSLHTASCFSSTGPYKRRRTKRSTVSNTFSGPLTVPSSNNNLQAMLETLIYIVQEMNLEQVKLTTTINQLSQRVHQNESYLNQLNSNIESLYEQVHVRHQWSLFRVVNDSTLDETVFGIRYRPNRSTWIIVIHDRWTQPRTDRYERYWSTFPTNTEHLGECEQAGR